MKKGLPRHNENWCWNGDVQERLANQNECHKALLKASSCRVATPIRSIV